MLVEELSLLLLKEVIMLLEMSQIILCETLELAQKPVILIDHRLYCDKLT